MRIASTLASALGSTAVPRRRWKTRRRSTGSVTTRSPSSLIAVQLCPSQAMLFLVSDPGRAVDVAEVPVELNGAGAVVRGAWPGRAWRASRRELGEREARPSNLRAPGGRARARHPGRHHAG